MSLSYTSSTGDLPAGFARVSDLPNATIVSGTGSPTLTLAQAGSLITLDAASTTVTLPTPVVGATFYFAVTTTASAQKILSPAGVFLNGALILVAAGAAGANSSAVGTFDGTGNRSFTMNGTTAGGIKGSYFTITAISSTVYVVSGQLIGSGSLSLTIANS